MYYGYVQVFLFLQVLLWVNLYHSRLIIPETLDLFFYIYGFMFLVLEYCTKFTIGFFTSWILIQYIVMVLFSVAVYQRRFNFKQALCLGFMTVYLNSFYWEIFYHVYEWQIWFPESLGVMWWINRLPQWIRLIPAYFIVNNFKVVNIKPLTLGLVVSYVLTYLRFNVLSGGIVSLYLHPFHRMLCLGILLYTVTISESRDHNGV